MPIYEYACACGRKEFWFRIGKAPKALLVKCAECGERRKRVPSVPAKPILKGAGFHSNDYGR